MSERKTSKKLVNYLTIRQEYVSAEGINLW